MLVRRVGASASTLLVVAVVAALPLPAAARPYRVSVVGDSIVEASDARTRAGVGGLARPLRRALAARGLRAGGLGHVSAHGAGGTHENQRHAWPLRYGGPWEFEGEFGTPPSRYGAAGLAAMTRDPTAYVEAALRAERIAVLYATGPDGGRFRFTVGAGSRWIEARGPRDGGGVAWLPAPATVDRLRVDEARDGILRFLGLIVHRDSDEVELNMVGHSGIRAAEPLSRENREALVALRPDLTILMLGTNDEGRAAGGDPTAVGDFRRGLELRARVARRTGRCVVVPHASNNRPARLQGIFRAAAARSARESGCAFEPVLAEVWASGEDSVAEGLTADGIHPTAAGYERMAKRLAFLIERHRRCDAQDGCPPGLASSSDLHWSLLALSSLVVTAVLLYARRRRQRARV